MKAKIEKINIGIDSGKINKLSNILPRKPTVRTTITEPMRLRIGVPSNNVINSTSITFAGRDNTKLINKDIKIKGALYIIQ